MENFIFCAVKPKKVESIIKEVVILDNYLRFTDKTNYTTHGLWSVFSQIWSVNRT